MPNTQVRKYLVYVIAVLAACFATAALVLRADPDVARSTTTHAANPDPITRGRYLVKTTGCNDCHTPTYAQRAGEVDEAQWLIGDSVGWQGPWGTTYAINLRRFVQTVTREQWLQVARQPARPPMPWFALRDMTDDDLTAIYQYIRSLGPAGTHAPAYVPPGEPVHTPVVRFPIQPTTEEAKERTAARS